MNWLIVGLLPFLLLGCATQNLPGIESYVAVPSSQILGSVQTTDKSEDTALAIVKRDQGFTGSALSSFLTIDGKRIALIKPGQYFELTLRPGEYVFGVAWSDDLGPLETGATREVSIDCKAGKIYYLRMFPQAGSGIVIERSSQ